ncbi:MAG: hypothetical protein M1812_003441 [Candelaria pacifica]|nr:MAG: hypothetical protein M1812_003441 [Candelaria pacifica]
MLSRKLGHSGNRIFGTIDKSGIGIFGSNFNVAGNSITNAGSSFPLPVNGFSLIDFSPCIKLLGNTTQALDLHIESPDHVGQLNQELHQVLKAVIAIRELCIDASQHLQSLAVKQAIADCQQCLETNLEAAASICCGPSRNVGGWEEDLKTIEWELCGKEYVEGFRKQMKGQTSALDMLLIQLRISSERPQSPSHLNQLPFSQAALAKIQDSIASNTTLLRGLTQQQSDYLESLMQIIRQQQELIQQLQQLPAQVELQRPVILLDACGRIAPFHLDFINSKEAFVAVLEVRFKDIGLEKIQKEEYILEERQRRREIDLSKPWNAVFMPGQKVDMSMIFQRSHTRKSLENCHGCGATGQYSGTDFECPNCGINCTRRIQDIEDTTTEDVTPFESPRQLWRPSPTRKRKLSCLSEPSIQDFRRVRVIEFRRRLHTQQMDSRRYGFTTPNDTLYNKKPQLSPESMQRAYKSYQIQLMLLEQRKKYHQMDSRRDGFTTPNDAIYNREPQLSPDSMRRAYKP